MIVGAALAAALLAGAPVRAQSYEHPREHWRIDFPAGWTKSDEPGLGTVARAPTGTARLTVEQSVVPASVRTAAAWERADAPRLRRRYGRVRVLLREAVALRGVPGARVEFDYTDPTTGRPMRGWRMVLLTRGVVDVVSFEVADDDYDAAQHAAEGSLKSFLPSFVRAPSQPAASGGSVANSSPP